MKNFLSTKLFFALTLLCVIFLMYGKAVNFDLLSLDDTTSISNNLERISKVKNIPSLFTTNCYNEEHATIPYYRPILVLTFSIETILFGYNTKVYHLGNLYLFIIALFVMYLFLLKLNFNKTISKFFLLLLAVHPVISSAAAYVSTRAEILLAIFVLLSFINLIDYLESGKKIYLVLYILLYTASLFTKESALAFFPLYFIFIFLFKYKFTVKEYIKLFVLLLVPTILYFVCRNAAVPKTNLFYFLTNPTTYINFINVMALYIRKILFPDYIHTILYNIQVSVTNITITIFFIIALAIAFYKKLADRRIIIVSLFAIIALLFPTVFMYENQVLYHRLFLPLFFLTMIFIQVTDTILKKKKNLKNLFLIMFIVLMTFFSLQSFRNVDKYINSDIFWLNMYKDASNYHMCCSGLAKQFFYAQEYEEALKLFKEAKALNDLYIYSLNICTALIALDRFDEAEKLLLELYKTKEDFVVIFYLSQVYYYKDEMQKAVDFAKYAYTLKPKDEMLLKHIERLPGFDLNIHKHKD
ncbi:MAG: hypothetical protein J6T23_03305 [Elusimicrobia bacterium]|nr:hypothetical protein [Elusimicrobiota bacterium]